MRYYVSFALWLIGTFAGAVAALPIYMGLPDDLRIAPNLYFITLGTTGAAAVLSWLLVKALLLRTRK